MTEESELKGKWWLPHNPKGKVSGVLKFACEKEAILELNSYFPSEITSEGKIWREDIFSAPSIILGVCNNKKITLYKSSIIKLDFSSDSYILLIYNIFIGTHFLEREDIKFKKVSVYYPSLKYWTNIPEMGRLKNNEVKGYLHNFFQATINKELKITLNPFSYLEKSSTFLIQKEEISSPLTEIIIETSEDKSFEYYKKIISHIRNFLSLGIGEPIHPLIIRGWREINKEIEIIPMELFSMSFTCSNKDKKFSIFNILFTLRDISNKFEFLMRNWFEKMDSLEHVNNLYFGMLYNPYLDDGFKFLSLIQAIEIFHRFKYRGEYLPDEDYKKIYDGLLNKVNKLKVKKELKDRLREYLKYGNEFSLRKRLEEIFNTLEEILNKQKIDKNKFIINKIVDTRNYLIHYHETLKERVAKNEELSFLIRILRMCVEICLLREIGFSSEEIRNFVSRSLRGLIVYP